MLITHTPSNLRLASAARTNITVKTTVIQPTSVKSFNNAAIGMSWQLAVIVIVPIVGGYKLDIIFQLSPVLTLLGLMVGLIGSIVVIRRAMDAFGNFAVALPDDKAGIDVVTTLQDTSAQIDSHLNDKKQKNCEQKDQNPRGSV